jgi:hypothetical protein
VQLSKLVRAGEREEQKDKETRCQKAFITLCSPVVPLLSTSKADSGLASEFRWDRAIYTAYERMLREAGGGGLMTDAAEQASGARQRRCTHTHSHAAAVPCGIVSQSDAMQGEKKKNTRAMENEEDMQK